MASENRNEARNARLLIIDDEANMRDMLSRLLKRAGYRVDTAADGRQGLERLAAGHYDFVLCDLKMPNMDGMQFLKSAREQLSATTVIMMSAYGTIDTAVEAMKHGAYDYISKPFKIDEVVLTLKKAQERERLKRENLVLRERIRDIEGDCRFGRLVAKSRAMMEVIRLAEKVAQYDTTVLITGESGTGKELMAQAIHQAGGRAARPFVAVNCGGIPETLLESEFFGHRRGAFTGAVSDKKGLFREADGGTLFLDEIGELPLALQVKLLRVLQESEVRPVGDSATRRVDVRVIAATARDLEAEVQRGNFREDLFFRLNVMPIRLPPLRERIEDIPLLSRHFVNLLGRRLKKDIEGIAPAAVAMLVKHHWPGNVRELENVIERAAVLAEKRIILPENLPPELGARTGDRRMDDIFGGFSLKTARRIMEKRLISRALEATGGNRTKAARLLEISHPSLLQKIRLYEIDL